MRLSECVGLNCSIKGAKAKLRSSAKVTSPERYLFQNLLISLIKANTSMGPTRSSFILIATVTRLSDRSDSGTVSQLFKEGRTIKKKFHVHSLRHSFATAVYQENKGSAFDITVIRPFQRNHNGCVIPMLEEALKNIGRKFPVGEELKGGKHNERSRRKN